MDTAPLEILKWTGIVLAAGFVGYFGRYLAVRLIDRMGGRKENAGIPPHGETGQAGSADAKLEKKLAKQAAKAAKKAGKR